MNKKIVLGKEYDEVLKGELTNTLKSMNFQKVSFQRAIVGSQDLQILKVVLNGAEVVIESETYMGLSICGPEGVVDEIVSNLGKRA